MSRTGRERAREADRDALRRRTIALCFHLVAEVVAIVGTLLTWSSVIVRDTPFVELPGRASPAGQVVFIASLVAFFFASYCLVADADIQLPTLIASSVALGASCVALYQVQWDDRTFEKTVEDVVRAGVLLPDTASESSQTPVIVAGALHETTSPPLESPRRAWRGSDGIAKPPVRLRLGMGLILAVVASIDMVVASLYLTLFAPRRSTE